MQTASRAVISYLRVLAVVVTALSVLAGCTTSAVMTVEPLPTEIYAAIVVDANSGEVLYERNANLPRYPASLTKMMTLYMLFEALDSGRLTLTSRIPVSAYAAKRPPTRIGFKAGESIDVESAVLALCVKSANDVASAVAEHLGGSEERFAAMMTAKARQIGMRSTVFRNASGLPDSEMRTTARDMALLAIALRERFPHYYHYFATRDFTYDGKKISGHNNLLGRVDGVDGIKTGYIRASGFNLATSVRRGGKRLVAVVMGGKSAKSRDAHMTELIETYLPRASRSAPKESLWSSFL